MFCGGYKEQALPSMAVGRLGYGLLQNLVNGQIQFAHGRRHGRRLVGPCEQFEVLDRKSVV